MPVTTSQQITRYYEQFANAEVTFTKEVIRTTMLNTKHVHLKCQGSQWPCILYASSMTSARIIANLGSSLNEALKKSNNVVQVRYSFHEPDKPDPITFFIPGKVAGITPYGEKNKELFFASVQFTQRPPDGLIQILGELLEANVNAKRRSEDRIQLTAHSVKQLGIDIGACALSVNGVPRKAIYRDLSFSGCRAILMGIAKLLADKSVVCSLAFQDPDETFEIVGTIKRSEPVEGRSDIAAFGIQFDEERVPMGYKVRINAALKQFRTKAAGND
ncbi:MAG: PilZ domain-containing protein [Spirochaetaceae bacterium]|nr:MAG: PilZ domain-containing protein [Spirochaetaceae bacterium]